LGKDDPQEMARLFEEMKEQNIEVPFFVVGSLALAI
jgi:hypothetical protein